jgi:hypothetical protein
VESRCGICITCTHVSHKRTDEFVFKSAGSFKHPKPVHNVIPGDFTQDGTLDLLVVADGISSNTLSMTVYTGQIAGGFCEYYLRDGSAPAEACVASSTLSVPPSSTVQPFVVDANGDLKIDLLGHTSTSGNNFKIWKNVWNSSSAHPDLFTVFAQASPAATVCPNMNLSDQTPISRVRAARSRALIAMLW